MKTKKRKIQETPTVVLSIRFPRKMVKEAAKKARLLSRLDQRRVTRNEVVVRALRDYLLTVD